MLNLNLIEIIKELSQMPKNRGVFHSEVDFQFQLGWKIKEKHKDEDVDVIFEKLINPEDNNDRRRIDIVVVKDGIEIPIELKYFTNTIDGFPFLRKQNDTWRAYDFIADISRNEEYIDKAGNTGYAILITNHSNYWRRRKTDNYNYHKFRLHEGRTISTNEELSWDKADAPAITPSRKNSISLNQEYEFRWTDYLSIKDNEGKVVKNGNFKVLIVKSTK